MRTIDKVTKQMIASDDAIEQLFIDTCKALGVRVYDNGCINTGLNRSDDDVVALLYLLREEGFDVGLTTGLLQPTSYSVTLHTR